MSLKPTPGFQNVIYFDQTNLPQGDISGNSDLTAYTQFEHMKFCLDMHNIATDINSIPTRTTNISDSNYDTILHTHFKLVIKAYLMYTDENQDELLGQRQYLLYYRKLKSETWDLTYGCGMCGYRVQIQLELRAEYLRKKYGRTNEIPSRHFNAIDKLAQRQWQNLCTTPINITNFSNYIICDYLVMNEQK